MLTNKYINKSTQKAFMPATPGCTEHHLKLTTILNDAKKKHRSLAVSWVDLANAYGSVHHSLILFSLRHYHAPKKLSNLVGELYSDLVARVSSESWSTPLIPIRLGVYQGDPLSVIIFNTVINTLVDTIQTRIDLGYSYSQTQPSINLLQYADDTCLIGNSQASCQHLLDMMSSWLNWSGMRAKITKCASLGLQSSTGRKINPLLSLDNQQIPFATEGVKFLGLSIDLPVDKRKPRSLLQAKLQDMLSKIDACPVTRKQKLLLYKSGVCPRLSWQLSVQEFAISWVEKTLDALVTRHLKRWSGLAKSANNSLLYLSGNNGGLHLPLPSTVYKKLQVGRQSHMLSSSDPSVRLMAERALQKDLTLTRPKFSASREVLEVMSHSPNFTRRSLARAAKVLIDDETQSGQLESLQNLSKQGQLSRCTPSDGARVWTKAVKGMRDEHLKFALNSAVDTLPHNANLCLWKRKPNNLCPLCGERQSLIHVLNCCEVARDTRRFNVRHDAVLVEIASLLSAHTSHPSKYSVDLGSYQFPQHIVATDLRPDIVWWNDDQRKFLLIELTICFETSFDTAAERKETKYEDLVMGARSAGYNGRLVTLQVGSRGVIDQSGFMLLKEAFKISRRDYSTLLFHITQIVISESHRIWCKRNYHHST